MTNKTEMVSVPRELLQDLIDSAQLEVDERLRAYGEDYRPHVLAAQRKVVADACAILAAPAEDVRAVGDEPVAAQWRYRNALRDGGIGPKEFGPWAELPLHRFNPDLTGYIDSIGYECETRALYLRHQRPTVMPKRHEDRCDSSEAEAYQNGWNACIDEFDRLNLEISK